MEAVIRVLLIEDSADDAELILRELHRGGIPTTSLRAGNRSDLQAALHQQTWDLVLSDFQMPGFSGLEALRMLQAVDPDVPFILISGAIGEEIAAAAMKAGAHDYIFKGNLARLCSAVERELRDVEIRRDKRRSEESLRQSQTRLETAQAIARMGDWEWNLKTNRTHWSKGMFSVYELEPETAPLDYDQWVQLFHREDLPKVLGSVEEAIAHHKPMDLEARIVLPNGSVRHVHILAELLLDFAGKPHSMRGTTQDITERKQLESLLRDLEKLSAKGQMAAYIAHEINNPLAGIKNALALLKHAVMKDHPHAHYGDLAMREVDRIAGIIRTMYHVYRAYSPETKLVPISNVFQDIESLLAPKCRSKGVEIEVDLQDPDMQIRVNEGLLRQILFNLVLNALDASHRDGVVTLSARFEREETLITVQDEGSGIPAELSMKIFEAGFTTKRDTGMSGMGLGLSTCKSLVESMGGILDHVPGPHGSGTIFRVHLREFMSEEGTKP